jgi:uncharacterized protein YceK
MSPRIPIKFFRSHRNGFDGKAIAERAVTTLIISVVSLSGCASSYRTVEGSCKEVRLFLSPTEENGKPRPWTVKNTHDPWQVCKVVHVESGCSSITSVLKRNVSMNDIRANDPNAQRAQRDIRLRMTLWRCPDGVSPPSDKGHFDAVMNVMDWDMGTEGVGVMEKWIARVPADRDSVNASDPNAIRRR